MDDQQYIFALRSDDEVNKYLGRKPARTFDDAVSFINKINENVEKNKSIYWAITLAGSGAFAGTICLFDFSKEKDSCEIGYELLPHFQGQGIMKEAAEKVIGYAFQTLQFHKIMAFTHAGNQRSTKLLESLNFIKSMEASKEDREFIIFTLTDPD